MSENLKRMGTFLLAVIMAFSVVPMGVFAQTPETEHVHQETVSTEVEEMSTVEMSEEQEHEEVYPELILDEVQDVVITEENTSGVYLKFVPEEDGVYEFKSLTDDDTYGAVYDDMFRQQLAYDDDSGEGMNFLVTCALEAGKTYYVMAKFLNNREGEFPVQATYSPLNGLESISFTPVSVIENTDGYESEDWDDETQSNQPYWRYSEWALMQKSTYTVTFADGTEITGNGTSFEYNEERYEFDYRSNQGYENRWLKGGEYALSVSFVGLTMEVPVTVVESPLQSITFTPVSVVENTCGDWNDEYYDEETDSYPLFWYYYGWDLLRKSTYTATFADGTEIIASGDGFQYDEQWYGFSLGYDQSYEKRWTVGNTYYLTVSVMGQTVEVPVTIVGNPLQNITFDPITITQNTCGSWAYTYDEVLDSYVKSYYIYYADQMLQKGAFTATFTDETIVSGSGTGFEYDGQWYDFICYTEQDEENLWLPGNTYTMTVSVMGQTVNVPVTITLPPRLTLNQVTDVVIEQDGEEVTFVFIPEEDGVYEFTSISDMDPYGRLGDHNDEYLTSNDDGGEDNNFLLTYSLEAGKTYMLTMRLWNGRTGTFQVLARKSPLSALERISFTPVSLMENSCGYMTTGYDEETESDVPYWYYYTGDALRKSTYTLTFSDGTVITDKGTGFEYNDEWYDFEYSSPYQNYENRWTVGNTYPITVSIAGKTAQVPVTITPSPLESIVFTPVFAKENECGYWDEEYVEDEGWVEYWRYDIWDLLYDSTFTATFSDGTVITDNGSGFWYEDEWYSFSRSYEQSAENPWLPGNTYTITISVMGQTAEVPVTICAVTVSDGYEYMLQGENAIIYSCSREDEVLQIPDTLDGYPVVGIVSVGAALQYAQKIVIPDSVTMISRDAFYAYNCGWYDSLPLTELVIGAGVSGLDIEMFGQAMNLETFTVSENSPYYCAVDGVLYNADCTEMVIYPFGKKETHVVPDSVKNVDVIFNHIGAYGGISIQLGAGVEGYVDVDGVIYNEEMTKVFFCTGSVTGSYVMPETVEQIAEGAFLGSNISELTISPRVTEIAYGAFMANELLEKVNMPSSVVSIGDYAFAGCVSLKSVEMPSSVRWVGGCAYDGCTDLEAVNITDLTAWCGIYFEGSVANPLYYAKDLYLNGKLIKDLVIPATVTETVYYPGINDYAFINGSMTSVTIPASVKSIGYGAFKGSAIEKATIAEGIYYMGGRVFAESALKSVVLPDSLTDLGSYAFWNCENLTSATIGKELGEIPYAAFYNTALTKIVIPQKVSYIGEDAFAWANISELVLNCDEVYIGEFAFQGCPVENMDFGDNVLGIGRQSFEGAAAYTLTIPETVTEISYRTFGYNKNLACVTIPDSVEYIYWNAFEGDDNLSHVLYTGTQQQWKDLDVYSDELNAATIHFNATGNEVTIQQTCSAVKLYCSVCKKWETVKELDGECNFAAATCTKAKTCKECGATEGSALGHKYKDATCTNPKTCSRCSATSGSKLGHKYKDATCTKPKTCSRCSATSGSKLGHKYSNSCDTTCNRCNAKRSVTHKYTAKTCGKTTKCSVCGKKGGKLAHSYTNACDTKCNRCGDKRTIKHDYENKTTKATEKKNGKVVKACSVCGKVSSTTTIYKIKSITLSTTKYTYNGKKQTPTVTVKDSKGNKLKKDTDYTVTYDSGRKNVGEYEVTVKFKGKYSGTEELEFTIVPKKSSIKKLTAKSKALEVKINRQTTQATGYQIEYATSKSFKSSTKVTVSDENTSKTTIKGLKKKKTYYVRIRTYKTVDGVKFYSDWSQAKSMKTK